MVDRGTAVRFLAKLREFCHLQPNLKGTCPLIQRLQEAISLELLEHEDYYILPPSVQPHLHFTMCLRGPQRENFTIWLKISCDHVDGIYVAQYSVQ